MSICSFCGNEIAVGRGVTVFQKDGKGNHFCSRKCERNSFMKRNPLRKKWTLRSKAAKVSK